jgi:hypothetical protein
VQLAFDACMCGFRGIRLAGIIQREEAARRIERSRLEEIEELAGARQQPMPMGRKFRVSRSRRSYPVEDMGFVSHAETPEPSSGA